MPNRQQALFAEVRPSEDEKLRALMRKLGISEFPTYEMKAIPPQNIIIPGAELLTRPHKLMRSIQQVGVLHAPAVVRAKYAIPGGAEDAKTYEVVLGRRRVLSVQLLDLPLVECKVYDRSTPQLRSLLALIENMQRGTAWIKEVEDLALLVGERVGLNLEELAELGFDKTTLKVRLSIAQLPPIILCQVLAGHVSYGVAKMIAGLSERQQNQLVSLVSGGEVISDELIKSLRRSQINAGLLQAQMGLTPSPHQEATTHSGTGDAPEVDPFSHSETPSLAQVLAVLQAYEQNPEKVDQSTRTLLRALIQRLRVLQQQQVA